MQIRNYCLLAMCLVFLSACSWNFSKPATPAPIAPQTNLANPASVNCEDKGGQVLLKTRPDGSQYGACLFEDNRQCEEWTLFRGECSPGDFKITGYENEAQIYCAITAGRVNMADKTCTFSDGMVCALDKYFSGQCLKTGLSDLIKVSEPEVKAKVVSPLVIKGEARGTWFFEASFPIELLDDQGNILAQGVAQAQSDWMTSDFVPFTAQLNFSQPSTGTGSLVLKNDNPSGLPANDKQIIISVIF